MLRGVWIVNTTNDGGGRGTVNGWGKGEEVKAEGKAGGGGGGGCMQHNGAGQKYEPRFVSLWFLLLSLLTASVPALLLL